LAAGADDYLSKPFSSADLVSRVRARLRAAERHRSGDPNTPRAQRETGLADLTTALAAADTVEAAAALLMAASPATLSATAIGIGLLDGGHLTLWYEGNITAELRQRYHNIAVGSPVPIAEVADTGQPMVITDTVALDPRFDPVVSDVAGLVHAAIVHPLRDGSGR